MSEKSNKLGWLRGLMGARPAGPPDRKELGRLHARAGRGDVGAQRDLGRAYMRGEGAPASPAEAARWLRLAAGAGDSEAKLLLASLHLQGLAEESGLFAGKGGEPNAPEAAALARDAAEAGNTEAMALWAFLLANGQGVAKDVAEAARWYERAAAAGLARAKLGLGMIRLTGGDGITDQAMACELIAAAAEDDIPTALYMLGTLHEAGVLPLGFDEKRAAELYRRAAEAGVRPASARLGLALLEGWGVERNPIEAETWLRRAAIAGDAEAAALVGDLHSNSADGLPNHAEAFNWYRIAAENGHRQAMRSVGLMYLNGLGAPRDREAALRWLGRAVEAGDTQAAADLGGLLQGMGQDSDEAAAVADVFETAARGGDPVAAFNYAVCLKGGMGRRADVSGAAEWMRFAGENGVVNALYWYGHMLAESGDAEGAREWIGRAADEGMPEAARELGRSAPG